MPCICLWARLRVFSTSYASVLLFRLADQSLVLLLIDTDLLVCHLLSLLVLDGASVAQEPQATVRWRMQYEAE
jgi:hypothetical protein